MAQVTERAITQWVWQSECRPIFPAVLTQPQLAGVLTGLALSV